MREATVLVDESKSECRVHLLGDCVSRTPARFNRVNPRCWSCDFGGTPGVEMKY